MAKALNTEAAETMRRIKKLINQTKITKKSISLSSTTVVPNPAKTPIVVATPLPPLSRKNNVQLCPQIQAKPKIILKTVSESFQ